MVSEKAPPKPDPAPPPQDMPKAAKPKPKRERKEGKPRRPDVYIPTPIADLKKAQERKASPRLPLPFFVLWD